VVVLEKRFLTRISGHKTERRREKESNGVDGIITQTNFKLSKVG
jgi:hypothetical protein